jgi:hypothetical protein
MKRNGWILTLSILIAVSAMGQDRSQWRTAADVTEGARGSIVGTVVDLDETRRELMLEADNDRYQPIRVQTDSVSTQYNGFGSVINGAPEIFVGSTGFANIREGDRLEIRGMGRAAGQVMADYVTLLGRTVAAPQTGVGTTRPAGSLNRPGTAAGTADVFGRVEGVIRQVNAADNRIVVETDRREMLTIRASSSTPVYYRGEVYQIRNLEVGDRIRVESDGGTTTDREIRARVIDVVQSVQERGTGTDPQRSVSSINGRVTRVDRAADMIRIDTGRSEIRVDMSRAVDGSNQRIRASDVKVGDRVDITGSYGSNADVFLASTVRFGEGVFTPAPGREDEEDYELGDYVTVTISGTISESLQSSPTLVIRDRNNGRTTHVFVTEDFVYRTKAGGYATADKLKAGDAVLLKAFRDEDGNLIAQTIRIR